MDYILTLNITFNGRCSEYGNNKIFYQIIWSIWLCNTYNSIIHIGLTVQSGLTVHKVVEKYIVDEQFLTQVKITYNFLREFSLYSKVEMSKKSQKLPGSTSNVLKTQTSSRTSLPETFLNIYWLFLPHRRCKFLHGEDNLLLKLKPMEPR